MDTTEHQQVEALKLWWRDNGRRVMAVLALAAVTYFGWQYWQHSKVSRQTQASEAFFQLTQFLQEEDYESFEKLSQDLMEDYANLPYAAFTAMLKARVAVDNEQYDEAIQSLGWAALHSSSPVVADIARLRQARILIATTQFDKASDTLKKVKTKAFDVVVSELQGDIALARNDKEEAKESYRQALKFATESEGGQARLPFIVMKLNDLGESVAATFS